MSQADRQENARRFTLFPLPGCLPMTVCNPFQIRHLWARAQKKVVRLQRWNVKRFYPDETFWWEEKPEFFSPE